MRTTLYELSEATRKTWGIDPYDNLDDFIFGEEGSIANKEGDVLEFKILQKFENNLGLDDFEIEILNIDEFPEIKENI